MLETFGSIIKEEEIITIEKGVQDNTFVLENLGAFPGYYGNNFTSQEKNDAIFLITAKEYSAEVIFRMTHEIKKYTGVDFDGSSASISFDNKIFNAIRVNGYEKFETIADLQKHYKLHGVVFAKPRKVDGIAVINIKKIFKITKITEDIYKDEEFDMYYLKVDRQIGWNDFRKITLQVRSNVTLSAFDAALAVIYASEVLDLIRIYSKTITLEELELRLEKYNEIIRRYY